ncbi:uncharacterized protein LOC131020427 isoform X2 [Salvia miltiorrhiza]|uniref:uncharacterized protein LOC131020427 isoform X2 n=1 Tax=Salvia miltiorrhiza TaxID=226208 RepID=UPI0025ACBF8E|nr:uncharacterized protein LOC131020427 isoform X2 [Salvia miltiorrhiza]
MESDIGRVDGNSFEESENRFDLENSGIQHRGPEKIADVEAVRVIEGGDGGKNAVVLSCVGGERPQVADGGSVELVMGNESATGGVAGTRSVKKKIVKKTVIVKRVIMKRVPKRVLINRTEDGINLSEVRINDTDPASDVIENSNVVDEVIEKAGRFNEAKSLNPVNYEDTVNTADGLTQSLKPVNYVDTVKEKPSIVCDVLKEEDIIAEVPQNLEMVNALNVSGPVVGEEVDDLSLEMELEMSKTGTNANVSEQMMPRNHQSCLFIKDADDIKGNDVVCEVERNNLTMCSRDLEVYKGKFGLENITERGSTMAENQSRDCIMENQRIDIVKTADMELLTGKNVSPIGDICGILGGKDNGRPIVEAESCSGEVESDGEMEALERKEKRKTEIFLGGLSKGTKEENIREVFEDVGSVVEVRIVVNPTSGKNRGFAFVRFATAADAKNALAKYSEVEICGKHCNAAPVLGNDTIFLGNIDRNWKTGDLVELLEKAGIEKIDKVTIKADPNNTERNRGFAFVELQTSKDAQTAFKKLQEKDAFGKKQMVKVAWAQPLSDPAEEEISQVKSVYAEYLPSSWDEKKVKEFFKRFGEIESVALAKDLLSFRRNDIAFINYTTCDAALTCIEAVNRERLGDDCSKVKMAVSLAKTIPKRKQMRHTSNPTSRQNLEAKENASQISKKLRTPRNKGTATSSSYDHVKVVSRTSTTSTTEELVQLLRQQASTKNNPPPPGSGAVMPDHRFFLPGSKRPFSQVGHNPLSVEYQGLSRVRAESLYRISGPSSLSHGVDLLPSSYHHQPGPESINGRRSYPNRLQRSGPPPSCCLCVTVALLLCRPAAVTSSAIQARDRASYFEDTNPYHRY